jgi:hypothetical protein
LEAKSKILKRGEFQGRVGRDSRTSGMVDSGAAIYSQALYRRPGSSQKPESHFSRDAAGQCQQWQDQLTLTQAGLDRAKWHSESPLTKVARAVTVVFIWVLLLLTSCDGSGTTHRTSDPPNNQPGDSSTVTIQPLSCLTSELLDQIRQDVTNIMPAYESCKDELVNKTYNLQLSEDHLKGVFAMAVANALAPYGQSSATTLDDLLEEDALDCDNYAILTGYLIEELTLGEYSYRIVGFDGGAVGNHAQSFLAIDGKEILLDATIGLVADIDLDSLLAGQKVPADKMVLLYAWNDPDILLFAEKVVDALVNGEYKPSDVIYIDGL